MLKKLSLKGSGASQNQKNFAETMTYKISETNSSSRVKDRTTGKV